MDDKQDSGQPTAADLDQVAGEQAAAAATTSPETPAPAESAQPPAPPAPAVIERPGRPRVPSLEEVKEAGYSDEAAPKIIERQKRLQELFDDGKSLEEANAIVQAEIHDLRDSIGTPKTDGDGQVLTEAPPVGPRGLNTLPDSLSDEQRKPAAVKGSYPNTSTDLVDSIGNAQDEQHFGPRGAGAPKDTFRA